MSTLQGQAGIKCFVHSVQVGGQVDTTTCTCIHLSKLGVQTHNFIMIAFLALSFSLLFVHILFFIGALAPLVVRTDGWMDRWIQGLLAACRMYFTSLTSKCLSPCFGIYMHVNLY